MISHRFGVVCGTWKGQVEQLPGLVRRNAQAPSSGGSTQEAPPFAAVLLLEGMQSFGLHKGGRGPSPLATFEKRICTAIWFEVSASDGVL